MSAQRLSLSSSVFSDRIKKFDTYEHDSRTSKRATMPALQKPENRELSTSQSQTRIGDKPVQPNTRVPLGPQAPNPQRFKLTNAPQVSKISSASARAKPSPIKLNLQHSPGKQIKSPALSSLQQPRAHIQPVQTLAMAAVAHTPAMNKSIILDQFQGMDMSLEKPKNKRSKLQTSMYGLAVALFVFASAVSVQTMLTNQQTQQVLGEKVVATDAQGVAEGTGSDPAEEPVSDNAIINYQVAPDMPRYLKIPDIGVFARIKHTGVTSEGAVDAPANIHDVSWYNGGAKPGDSKGSSLLLGHVQGWSAPGVFKKIDKLQPGARFTVEKGDGSTITYEVTRTQDVPLEQVDMRAVLSEEVPGDHDLKLMTCSGNYNRETEIYDSRYIVYAKIIR